MELNMWKQFVDYGGMFLVALVFIGWILRIDIPAREKRIKEQVEEFKRERQELLNAFKEERAALLNAFKDDRDAITHEMQEINKSIMSSSRTCAITRSLGMVQYLMEKDSSLSFDSAANKVSEYWKLNGVNLELRKRDYVQGG